MKHDVFISFSSVNTDVAEKVCASLEESGRIKCWIAFRDIVPSANYAEQLVEAIESCKLVLLILSAESNRSPQVSREIERAGSKGIPILPLRIENVRLSKSMEYFISSHHWLDAYEGELENYFPALKSAVEASVLGKSNYESGIDVATRKSAAVRSGKKIKARQAMAVGLGALIVAAVLFFARIQPEPPEVASTPAPPQPVAAPPDVSPEDSAIRELVRRYRENQAAPKPETDGWTSSHKISIAFLDVSASGVNAAEQDFILNRTAEELRATNRYAIVERELIDKLLKELNLSSSELADPATALKLGRILSANLIVTGSLARQEGQWLANLRFIETETTAIKCSVSAFVKEGDADRVASELGAAISVRLRGEYPLQARIASVSGQDIAINIGRQSGVAQGMEFELLQDNIVVDTVAAASVEQDRSFVTPSAHSAEIAEGMQLREKTEE